MFPESPIGDLKKPLHRGTGSKRIHEATLLSFDIAVPDEQEQKLIATCINGITNLITLHQRKLEHLQLQKKALLQQMFV